MKEITPQDLKVLIDNQEDFQLIDVRETYEFDTVNIGGELIPLAQVLEKCTSINKEKKVIIHCKSGARSAAAVQQLEKTHGYTNLYNLKGGILAYIREVDPSLTAY